MSNVGIEAIKKLREKREAEKEKDEVKEESVESESKVESYMLHDDSLYRVNLLNHMFEINQSLKKLVVLLGGEEKED